MRIATTLAALLAASTAAAQPAANESCQVDIARAPEDVRNVVEAWVKAEPRCSVSLEVRIVPTDGGLYLMARDHHGRVRERIVPDAQSAGVLVASWVAADSMNDTTPFDVRAPGPAAPAVVEPPPAPPVASTTPVVAAAAAEPAPLAPPSVAAVTVAAPPAPQPPPKWWALGGMFAMSGTGGGGVRGEIDLRARPAWSVGAVASLSQSGMMVYEPYMGASGTLDTTDLKLLGYVASTARIGRWQFRPALGLGVVYTRAVIDMPSAATSYGEAEGAFPTAEASFAVARELGERWAVAAGPVFSLYFQEYQVPSTYGSVEMQRRDVQTMMFVSLRHRR